jgi:hypothetical protein
MIDKHEKVDPSPVIRYIVESMIIDSITQVDDKVTKREDMLMKNASPLDSYIINGCKYYLQNTGTCVIDKFIGMYGAEFKITREKFIDMCQNYHKENNNKWAVKVEFLQDV